MIRGRQGIPRLHKASLAPLMSGEVLVNALFTLKPDKQELKVSLHIRACKLQSNTVPSVDGGAPVVCLKAKALKEKQTLLLFCKT